MVGSLILRGLVVGLFAGLLAFGYARVYGEPSLDSAIAFEELLAAAEGEITTAEDAAGAADHEEEVVVSREVQSSIGLLTGTAVLGAGLGGIFAVLFALANGRIGRLGPQQTSLLLAALCFVSVFLVPWLKYPANPPASTDDTTVQLRTSLFLLMMAVSIGAMIGSWVLRQRLLNKYGSWNASLIGAGAYVVVIGVFALLLPTVSETPADFPAVVFWDFRMASLGTNFVLWATIGLAFGFVVERTMIGSQMPARRTAAAN